METIEEFLKPAIDILPEPLREYWLVVVGAIALVVLLPIAWYKRRLIRRLISLPRRVFREEPNLDEDLAKFAPTPGQQTSKRLFIEGVPAQLRLVVAASLGKGPAITEAGMGELLDKVRWGLGAMARHDQAAVRVWPMQISANGFPSVVHRHIRKDEALGQASHWILLAGPTPPRPHSVLLGLALWTDEATTIGNLNMDASQWMRTLHFENLENLATESVPGSAEHPVPAHADGENVVMQAPHSPKTGAGPSN